MKDFIITMDTEGDNLWQWEQGSNISTENILYLDRFQQLCNRFGFKPVWLTNYEMISDDRYVEFILKATENNHAELGMHLHAWNNPPIYELKNEYGNPSYLIEYPDEIMKQKIEYLTSLIIERTGITPVSHRAGRWAMDKRYYELLGESGYLVDCSVTPHVNWQAHRGFSEGAVGTNYEESKEESYWINNENGTKILEVPVTIRNTHHLFSPKEYKLKNMLIEVKKSIKGRKLWMRPDESNAEMLLWLEKHISLSNSDYLMFMLHSSELMPGANPTFKTEESIEKLYINLEKLFEAISCNFQGITLKDYYLKQEKKGV